jgi:SpoVK/Ycf46/Vps4 family AAA+-type ATPase
LTQDALAKHSSAFVVFDEVEDVFPAVHELSHSTVGVASGERTKGWLTKLLEVNRRPTFWLCNQIHHIDPAYLRRFDLVIEARGPNIDSKRRIVDRLMADVPLGDVEREAIAHEPCMSVGHLTKLSSALAAMAGSADRFPPLFRQIINEWRNAHGERHIRHSGVGRIIRYREDCLNADVDLPELASALVEAPSARIFLHGPSGTGKSEWARYLSDRLGRKLIAKRGSDLLSRYVGETEKRIREAFSVAEHDNALLVIDEAEGLIRDRTDDVPHWQVSMTNEFLTSMEAFEGICVITTNTIDLIDSAALRRFDFKVELKPLSPSQSKELFLDLLTTLGVEPPSSADLLRIASLRSLTPGDFASVARQNRIMRRHRSASDLVDALAREMQFKPSPATLGRIGFLRDKEVHTA